MELCLLGTAAAEAWPAPFCRCAACDGARHRGGPNLRGRSGALIDDDLKIDWGPDTIGQLQKTNRHAANVRTLVFTHQHSDHLTPAELLWAVPPYTNTPPAQPIVVYGNEAVLASINANVKPSPQANNLDPRPLLPFEPVTTPTGDTILALPADHGAAGSLVLRITRARDSKTLFYGHDSGLYPEETLDALQNGPPFDIGLFDCTHGGQAIPNRNHMGVSGVIEIVNEMKKRGLAAPDAKFIATHFSHNGGLLHEELCETFLPNGIMVAFDGMVIHA